MYNGPASPGKIRCKAVRYALLDNTPCKMHAPGRECIARRHFCRDALYALSSRRLLLLSPSRLSLIAVSFYFFLPIEPHALVGQVKRIYGWRSASLKFPTRAAVTDRIRRSRIGGRAIRKRIPFFRAFYFYAPVLFPSAIYRLPVFTSDGTCGARRALSFGDQSTVQSLIICLLPVSSSSRRCAATSIGSNVENKFFKRNVRKVPNFEVLQLRTIAWSQIDEWNIFSFNHC